MNKLTIKQEKFAQGLFVGKSQREAYKEAYDAENMTDKSIDEKACELAKNVKVAERLKQLNDVVVERAIWSVEEILKDIKAIALDPEAKRLEKLKALELGGKHLGMFTDRIISENTNVNIEVPGETAEDKAKYLLNKASDEDLEGLGLKRI